MAGRKFHLGRSRKNAERKKPESKRKKPGRPKKKSRKIKQPLEHHIQHDSLSEVHLKDDLVLESIDNSGRVGRFEGDSVHSLAEITVSQCGEPGIECDILPDSVEDSLSEEAMLLECDETHHSNEDHSDEGVCVEVEIEPEVFREEVMLESDKTNSNEDHSSGGVGVALEMEHFSYQICLKELDSNLQLPDSWVHQLTEVGIKICCIMDKPVSCDLGNPMPMITRYLIIRQDLSWNVGVHGKIVQKESCSALSNFPEKLHNITIFQQLVSVVCSLQTCIGNPDDQYVSLVMSRKGKMGRGQIVSAFVDNYYPVYLEGTKYDATVRSSICELLVNNKKCNPCKSYRSTLRALHSRGKHSERTSPSKRTNVSSHVNFRYLTTPEKATRFANCSAKAKVVGKELDRLKKRLAFLESRDGISFGESLNHDFTSLFEDSTEEVQKSFHSGSFERLFWEQQAESLRKDKRHVRWHPMIIKWCLNIKLLSSSAYSALRSSGIITLPSERTLRDYTHFVKACVGFSVEVDAQLQREAKLETITPSKRHVCLVFDEVKIKEDLVYDKYSGEMIGFVNLGDLNNKLAQFQHSCLNEAENEKPPLATHMLVFMVCGILSELKFPYAQFPCTATTADQLYSLVWGCVSRLEGAGFKVLAVTCDGAASNRKFFKLHGSNDEFIFKTTNPYSDEARPLFFISDVPHLIKTTRNCWANSFGHNYSRTLHINGKNISWQHIAHLYYNKSNGLSILHKIKWEHIHLTSYSKMRVDLAAQVLSNSVCKALELEGDSSTTETQRFVAMFNKFFDLLNVRSLEEGVHERNSDKAPYRSPNDERLKWLEDEFLSYLEEWKTSAIARKDLSASQRIKLCLSPETMDGLKMTVKSFVEICRYLLSLDDVKFVLSGKFSQDPLENYFGRQRMRGGYSDNPTVRAFIYGTSSLRVQGSVALKPVRGNCSRGSNKSPVAVDNSSLPKRPRKLNLTRLS